MILLRFPNTIIGRVIVHYLASTLCSRLRDNSIIPLLNESDLALIALAEQMSVKGSVRHRDRVAWGLRSDSLLPLHSSS